MLEVANVDDKNWDELISQTEFPSAFLTSWWLRSVEKHFQRKLLLLRIAKNNLDCLTPVYIAPDNNSFSVGFIGYGGLNYLTSKIANSDSVINAIQKYTSINNFSLTSYPHSEVNKIDSAYNITENTTRLLDLSALKNKSFNASYSGKVRTAIRKASRSGVQVCRADINDITTIHRLVNQTQSNVKSQYKTPLGFLEFFFDNDEYARVYKASLNSKIIATCVVILSKFEMSYYLNGWDRSYSSFYPNQAIIHNMIQDAISWNIRFFNFGVSHYDSLDKSKSQWGGDKYKIYKISNIGG